MLTNLHLVDTFGELKARLADLENEAAAVRDQIVALGAGAHDGDLFRATVSIAPRATVDWKAIAVALRPSFEFPRDRWSESMVAMVDANTTAKDVTTVRVVARKKAAA